MTRRVGIQLCYPLEERRILSWAPPYIVQPKLNGERCRAILNPAEPYPASVTLLTSEANVFQSVPHLLEPLHKLAQLTGPIELDGEMYVKGMSFEEISSILGRTVNIHSGHEEMQLHLFDVVNEALPQWERLKILARVKSLCSSPEILFVPSKLVETFDEIIKAYEAFVEDGYEGIVVRHVDSQYVRRRSLYTLKFKPKKEDTYKIVGFTQMKDKNKVLQPALGALWCVSNEGEQMFKVGTFKGITKEFRYYWWPEEKAQELVGKSLRVKYQQISNRGVPNFGVGLEIVEPIVNPFL
jgi:ATP-dependent DNA ligase